MFKTLKSKLLIFSIISLLIISPAAAMAASDAPGFFNQAKDFVFNKVGNFFTSVFGGEAAVPIIITDAKASVKTASASTGKTTSKKATSTKKTTVKKTTTAKKTTTKKATSTAVVSDSELKNIIRKEIAELLKMTGQIAIEETNRLRNYLKNYSATGKSLIAKTASSSAATSTEDVSSGNDENYDTAITPSASFVLSSFSFLDSLTSLLHVPESATPSSSQSSQSSSPTSESSSTEEIIISTSTDVVLEEPSGNVTSTEAIIVVDTPAEVSTTTEIIADVSTTTEIIVASSTPVVTENSSSTTEIIPENSSSTVEVAENDQATSEQAAPLKLLISRIYVTGDNDLIELYNPMSVDIDLAAGNYRLEKTKTSVDPSILMRFGNAADGTYPGGTVIKSGEAYLIVRDKAEAALKEKAQAIVTAKAFTFDASGYTIYLGNDAISGPIDENVIDYVGFGAANFYEGLAPAPEISDNYILQRKISEGLMIDTDNNNDDFSLLNL